MSLADDDASRTRDALASRVREFYDGHPYPPPADDIEAYARAWDDRRRRADAALFWPGRPYRNDRSILVAGCGTVQAAHYAVRWPNARVVGIDVSAAAIEHTEALKRKHGLDNLEIRRLPVERAGELEEAFEYVVCTGVLHHLPDPDAGLRALREAVSPEGVLHVMVYAPFGRTGIYLLQEYCRRIGVDATDAGIRDLAALLRALPQGHPIVPLLRESPDFASVSGLADALLNPNDRAYSVPEFMQFLRRGGFVFARWLRQAPYSPGCGAIASTPHAARLAQLPPEERYAAMELFRGTMVRHNAIAYRDDVPSAGSIDFDGDAWLDLIPMRSPGSVVVRERVPDGFAAVLINTNHIDTDLYLPIDAREEGFLKGIDGKRTLGELARADDSGSVLGFLQRLWEWDQVLFCR